MGWREIAIENAHLRLAVLPDKGGEIVSLEHRASGTELLARLRPTPEPGFGAIGPGADEASFNRWYAGGWQELFANGDAPCEIDGIVHSFHGDAWYRPWPTERVDETTLAMRVTLEHIGLHLERTIRLDDDTVVIDEHLSGDRAARILWGHHPAFGPPLVGPGARIVAPVAAMETMRCDGTSRFPDASGLRWPDAHDEAGDAVDASRIVAEGSHDLCLLRDLPDGRLAIENADVGLRVDIGFDPTLFRWAWIWMLAAADRDPPFDGTCVALEPWTGPPGLPRALADGYALAIQPGEPIATRLTLTVTAG